MLLCENAGKSFEDCINFLRYLPNDKNSDVRMAFYSVIYKIMVNMKIIYLRKYEHNIVLYLMNGLSDERDDIKKEAYQYIEKAGKYREKLASELEEELV